MPNRTVIRLSLFPIITLLLILSPLAHSEIISVPQDQPTVQAGIDAAVAGDTVLVAPGTYTGPGNRDIDPDGKAITLRSAGGPASCVIDCQGTEADPHRGFFVHSGETNNCLIKGFTIRNGYSTGDGHPGADGGGILCQAADPTIEECIITNCRAVYGGGISCRDGGCTIRGCTIRLNTAENGGGGIELGNIAGNDPRIEDTVIDSNFAQYAGGISIYLCGSVTLHNCRITDNMVEYNTSAISMVYGKEGEALTLSSCTVSGNGSETSVSGINCYAADLTIVNSILWNNTAGGAHGNEIDFWIDYSYYSYYNYSYLLILDHTDVDPDAIYVHWHNDIYWGPGMITADPVFASGPGGDFFLSQATAGQAAQSPCVDAGHPGADLLWGTTRTDEIQDSGIIDMGWHAPCPGGNSPDTLITAGPEGTVNTPVLVYTFSGIDDQDPPEALFYSWRMDESDWTAWIRRQRASFSGLAPGPHTFDVRSRDSAGYFDPTPERREVTLVEWDEADLWGPLVTGPGPGPANPPLVRTSRAQWLAYGVMQRGVNVAAGDLNGDGIDEIVTGPGPGELFGAHVRGWNADGTPLPWLSYLAYGTRRYGVNVACGDVDGDGMAEIVTGAGPGAVFGPHVRGWNSDGGTAMALPGVSFFAYGTLRWGVNAACGDVDGDGMAEIITGAGPGPPFGPHVRGWNVDGGAAAPMPGLSFFAYGTPRRGVNVGSGDIDGDGLAEILTAPGPSPAFGAHIRAWDYDGAAVTPAAGISFFAYTTVFGAAVGAADVDHDGAAEILTMPGPNPSAGARARVWNADGGTVSEIEAFYLLAYDEWMTYGGRIAAGNWE